MRVNKRIKKLTEEKERKSEHMNEKEWTKEW